jgi:HTH-type transcriptional regulator/antitoxin HigA
MATASRKSAKKKRTGKVNKASRRTPIRETGTLALRSDAQLADAIQQIDSLLLKGRLNRLEQERLNILTRAVERYESRTVKMPAVSDVAMLRHLIEANDLTQIKLADESGVAMSTISEILNGKRKMNLSHIRAFAKRFGVKPGAFLDGKLTRIRAN